MDMTSAPLEEERHGLEGTKLPRSLVERQLRLLVLCGAVLIVVIDGTVVNVALPTIKQDLNFSQSGVAWVLNAYLISFGGFLLLGGRFGDILGRKKVLVGGLTLFTGASFFCGLASNQAMLIGGRFAQGLGAALASSVVLALIASMFPTPRDQLRALGVYGLVLSAGGALGLLAGAVLTERLAWNWVFYINVPLGIIVLILLLVMLDEDRSEDEHKPDVAGAMLITGALMLLVYTVVQTDGNGWTTVRTGVLAFITVVLFCGFWQWERRAADPLVTRDALRQRNVVAANVVQCTFVAGLAGTLFLGTLLMQQVLGYTAIDVGWAFMPMAVTIAVISLKFVPWAFDHFDARTVFIGGQVMVLGGLAMLAWLPSDPVYVRHVLGALMAVGAGVGLGTPAILQLAIASADEDDVGLVSGIVSTTQQIGSALGLAVVATMAANRAESRLAAGVAQVDALTDGFRLAFAMAAALVSVGIVLALLFLKTARPVVAPTGLDSSDFADNVHPNLDGVAGADLVALGLGGTNMMAMLWTVALGRRAVGVEMRGGPFMAFVQWGIRDQVWHDLVAIDRLMHERYSPELLPTRVDGRPFRLAEALWDDGYDELTDTADEFLNAYSDGPLCGLIRLTETIDDRGAPGQYVRSVTSQGTVQPSLEGVSTTGLDRSSRSMTDVLRQPLSLEVQATEILVLLRRYLEAIEAIDLARGVPEPRVRILDSHRVVPPHKRRFWSRRHHQGKAGFTDVGDGRRRIVVEKVRELDDRGRKLRVRVPNSDDIDLGVPELFVIGQGMGSVDAARLGFRSRTVAIDHGDGAGPVRAQSDYLGVATTVFVDGRHRIRLSSDFDGEGREYWIRQMAFGREGDAQIGWLLLEVPDFRTFDPVVAGLVPPTRSIRSAEWFAGHRHLLFHYFIDEASKLFGVPKDQLSRATVLFGPKLFRFVLRIGDDPQVAANGVVAGDSFGTGMHLRTEGPTVAMVGHADRVRRYWLDRDDRVAPAEALRRLADGINEDTKAWITSSVTYLARPGCAEPVIVEGVEPVRGSDRPLIEAARRHRYKLVEKDHFDQWGRFLIHYGRVLTDALPSPMASGEQTMIGQVGPGEESMVGAMPGSPVTGRMPDDGLILRMPGDGMAPDPEADARAVNEVG